MNIDLVIKSETCPLLRQFAALPQLQHDLQVPRKALMQINQCIGSGRKLYGQPVPCSIAVSVGCVSSQCRSCSLVTPP